MKTQSDSWPSWVCLTEHIQQKRTTPSSSRLTHKVDCTLEFHVTGRSKVLNLRYWMNLYQDPMYKRVLSCYPGCQSLVCCWPSCNLVHTLTSTSWTSQIKRFLFSFTTTSMNLVAVKSNTPIFTKVLTWNEWCCTWRTKCSPFWSWFFLRAALSSTARKQARWHRSWWPS